MLAFAVALAALPTLHLADLLREAHEKNPELRAAQARAGAAQASVSPAGALDDPMLMVQIFNAPFDLSSVPLMFQITQPLPLGGKRAARTDVAKADAAMAQAEYLARQRELDTQVAGAYYDLFLAERTLGVDDDLQPVLQALLHAAEARVATGAGPQAELLRAQAALIQLRSERETALDARESAWARMAALLDRDPTSSPGTTAEPRVLASLPDLPSLSVKALIERPEIRMAQAQIDSAHAQQRLAKAASVPDVAVFGGVMHTFRQVDNMFSVGVTVNLPLFGDGKNRPRVAGAEAQMIAAQESERGLRNRIMAEVAEQYAHLMSEQHQIELHHQLIPIARQAVQSAESSYAAGRAEFAMVIDGARELRMHQLELAMHLATYEQRLAELQRAVGADLGLTQAAEGGHEENH